MSFKNLFSRQLLLVLFVSTTFCQCVLKNDKSKQINSPNIVFILIDDLGWSDLNFMGNPVYETPVLDNLSKEGVVFTNAYAPAANCAPSRASIMSGKNTPYHGIYTVGSSERGKAKHRKLIPAKNKTILDDDVVTMAEYLKRNGYATISIGKWHLGEDPMTQGFDFNIGGTHAGHPKSYFSPYKNKAIKDGNDGEYLTDRLTDEAIKFMSVQKDNPFFLYLPFFTVHTPLQGKKNLVEKYKSKINGDTRFNPKFGAMVESMDQNIGKIIQAISDLNLEENTIVIFTSDNGGLASVSSQFPLRAGKGSYYEGGIRVPMIIKWPEKIKKPFETDIPVSGLDIFPTLTDVVGENTDIDFDGASLLPLISENKAINKRELFWHFPIYLQAVSKTKDESRDSLFRTRPGSVIRSGKWKLHEYFEDNALELYNLEIDLYEQTNLVNDEPEKAKELLSLLRDWRKKVNAPVPNEANKKYVSVN